MTLTNQQILSLADAITHLDGHHLLQVVEGKAVSVFKGYRLAHAARWSFACTIGKLQTTIAAFNRAKDALIKQHTGGASAIGPTHANWEKFVAEMEELKQQAVELNLDHVALDALKLDENEKSGNEFPIAVLNALAPLIKAA